MTEQDFLTLTPFLIIASAPIIIMVVISILRNYKVVYWFSVLALMAAFASIFFILPIVASYDRATVYYRYLQSVFPWNTYYFSSAGDADII